MTFFRLIAFLLLLTLSSSLCANKSRGKAVTMEVWNAIAERNYVKDFDKKYRKKILDKYLPLAMKCKTDAEIAHVLNRMIAQIGQSHIRVFPPVGFAAIAAKKAISQKMSPPPGTPFVPAGVGVQVCRVDDSIRVLHLKTGFPAAKAGIKPGDEIISINGLKIEPDQTSSIPWTLLGERLLWGLPKTDVRLQVSRPAPDGGKGRTLNYTLTRKANGGIWFQLGIMPRFASLYESRILPGNIGYIRFTVFTPAMVLFVRNDIMGKLKNVNGIVLDIRNNPGGIIISPQFLAGWLSRKPVSFGQLISHRNKMTFKSYPQKVAFKGKLAILINEGSASAAEVCAAGFQDSDAAKIFGSRSSGECLPSMFIQFDDGFRLQTVSGNLIRANGKAIEHVGVTPDVEVKQTVKGLLKGQDAALNAAVKYLKK